MTWTITVLNLISGKSRGFTVNDAADLEKFAANFGILVPHGHSLNHQMDQIAKTLSRHHLSVSIEEKGPSKEELAELAAKLKAAMSTIRSKYSKKLAKSDVQPPEKPAVVQQAPTKLHDKYRRQLEAIALMESTGHQYRDHAMVKYGVHKDTKSVSSYGLMPIQVAEIASKSPKFAKTDAGKAILQAAQGDPRTNWQAITAVTHNLTHDKEAAAHLWDYNQNRLSVFASPQHDMDALGAYAHRNGVSATFKLLQAPGGYKTLVESPYVKTFLQRLNKQPVSDKVQKSDLSDNRLSKSVPPADFKRLQERDHKEGRNAVDESAHVFASVGKIPQHITQTLESPEPPPTKRRVTKAVAGIARKAVYDTEDGKRFMLKPYHAKPERGTTMYVKKPIMGWAVMANRGLYEAAGIGHLCENVHAAIHNGLPVTIHDFHPDAFMAKERLSEPQDPGQLASWKKWREVQKSPQMQLELGQIGLMDFLTNNNDRHAGNLVFTSNGKPLAIDHERSFQYIKSPMMKFSAQANPGDTVHEYWKDSPMGWSLSDSMSVGRPAQGMHYELASWLLENEDNLRKEMDKHLAAIKDTRLQQHIRQNFHGKLDYLVDLCNKFNSNELHEQYGDKVNLFGDHGIRPYKFKKYPKG